VLTAALTLLLGKYSGNDDIILVTPVLKTDIDSEPINTLLILRNQLPLHMTFKELILEVRQTIHEAYEHRNYPIEILTRELNLPDHTEENHSPLFDVALLVENIHDKQYLYQVNPGVIFSFLRTGEDIELHLEYDSSVYDKQTMERITTHLQHLLQQVNSNVDIKIADLDIVTEEEKKQLLIDFNNTKTGYLRDQTIHELFEKQVEKSPDHTALVGVPETHETHQEHYNLSHMSYMTHISYNQLNKKSNQLAYLLKEKGVQADTIVAVMVERSAAMIIGILGILKTGAAYLPIDPEYPKERIDYMLKDSGAKILLTGQEIADLYSSQAFMHLPPASVTSLAYIIYTSGSTGRPKGVLVEHRSAANTLIFRKEAYELDPGVTALQLF